jgi:hypothetical protein
MQVAQLRSVEGIAQTNLLPRSKFASPTAQHVDVRIGRYGERYWAVYVAGELLAVTVYKKGAVAVRNALMTE